MKKLLVLITLSSALLLAVSIGSAGSVRAGVSNNDFNNATVINSLPFDEKIDIVDATNSANDPDISDSCFPYSRSVWYQYKPSEDQVVNVDTFGSDYDTILAVFTGTKGDLNLVACNDESGGLQSHVAVILSAGTTYYILAADWSSPDAFYSNLRIHVDAKAPSLFADITLKCYQAKIAKGSPRFQRQSIYTSDVNFHFSTETSVTGLSLFCNQADQEGRESGGDEPKQLGSLDRLKVTCYAARDTSVHGKAGTISGRRVFAQNKFGDQKLQLNRLESICVIAVKDSGQMPQLGFLESEIARCYTARSVKGGARFEPETVYLSDQFAGKDVRVLRPVSYCTISGKGQVKTCIASDCGSGGIGGTNGTDEFDPEAVAVVCYAIRQASFQPFNVPVIDQFIDQQFVDPFVTIKKADRLCTSSVKKPPFAPNDDISHATTVDVEPPGGCAAALEICPFDDHVVTMNATRTRNDPPMIHCESVTDHVDYGHSVWYTFTPNNADEAAVDVDTEDSSYDTVLAFYTGTKGNLTQIACNDDDPSEAPATTSKLELDLQIGQKYYIMVGSKDRTPGGKLKLSFDCDTCDD